MSKGIILYYILPVIRILCRIKVTDLPILSLLDQETNTDCLLGSSKFLYILPIDLDEILFFPKNLLLKFKKVSIFVVFISLRITVNPPSENPGYAQENIHHSPAYRII